MFCRDDGTEGVGRNGDYKLASVPADAWDEDVVHEAAARMTPELWAELRRIARREHGRVRAGETLRATALVSEAWLKLRRRLPDLDDAHFLNAAAVAMRHVLVDHARRRLTAKRGEGKVEPLDEDSPPFWESDERLVDLNVALDRLGDISPRLAKVTELRFFAGYSDAQIATILDLTGRTVRRDWVKARAWLYRELNDDAASDPTFTTAAGDSAP